MIQVLHNKWCTTEYYKLNESHLFVPNQDMNKKNVAVLCGGTTAERNISLESGEVVYRSLDRSLYVPFKVEINADNWVVAENGAAVDKNIFGFTSSGSTVTFDMAFVAIHGSPGEDGKLQGYLEMMGIPFTCCDTIAAAISFNKSYCKQVVQEHVATAKGMLIHKKDMEGAADRLSGLQLPLFVKPNNNGSSYGISRVNKSSDLMQALEEGLQYDDEILVEEAIIGTEVTCGLYRYKGEVVVLPICEIVAGEHEFFNYTAKYIQGESDEIIPARIHEETANAVKAVSAAIYDLLGCSGVVRIDYILKDGVPYFLEVNTVPGLSAASIVPKMAIASGLTLTDFFTRLLSESL